MATLLNLAPLAIFGVMLVVMLMRVALPIGVKVPGKKVAQVKLDFRERLLLHRMNVYSIGIMLLIATVAGVLPRSWELLIMLTATAILFIPIRYTLTSEGIAFNNVVFRPWSDFIGAEASRRYVRLTPKPETRPFDVRVLGSHQASFLSLARRFLPPSSSQESGEVRSKRKAIRARSGR